MRLFIFAVLGLVAAWTLFPGVKHGLVKRQFVQNKKARIEAMMRADFKGTLAYYEVSFPASPRLHVINDCEFRVRARGCSMNLASPDIPIAEPNTAILHERGDPISFNFISVSEVEPTNCGFGAYCVTQKKVDRWCGKIRPDLADSIWCRDKPPMGFSLRTDESAERAVSSSSRDEPELTELFTDTILGPGQVACFYHPNPAITEKKRQGCELTFQLVDGITVLLGVQRAEITSGDPKLAATIELIPDYWKVLTGGS